MPLSSIGPWRYWRNPFSDFHGQLLPPPAPRRRRSPLEQLPQQLLERICILSGNVNLPRASPCLLRALDTDTVKHGLVMRVLTAWVYDVRKEIYFHPLPGESKFSSYNWPWLHASRAALLRVSWCTPEFLERCLLRAKADYALDLLPRQIRRAPPHEQRQRVQQLADFMQPWAEAWKRAKLHGAEPSRAEPEAFPQASFGRRSCPSPRRAPEFFSVRWGGVVEEHMEIMHRTAPSRRSPLGVTPGESQAHTFKAPLLDDLPTLPTRLIHGPFAQPKGDLVAALEHGGPRGGPWPTPLATADECAALQDGLEDARVQSCVPALLTLLCLPGRNEPAIAALMGRLPSRDPAHGPYADPRRKPAAPWASGLIDLPLVQLRPAPTVLPGFTVRWRHFEALFERRWDYNGPTFQGVLRMLLLESVASNTVEWSELRACVDALDRAAPPWWRTGEGEPSMLDVMFEAQRDLLPRLMHIR